MNRTITTEVQTLTDSVSYYKLKYDTLAFNLDSISQDNSFKDNQIELRDMIIYQAQQGSPRMMDEILKNTEGLAYEK
jgi:hypothetical protein